MGRLPSTVAVFLLVVTTLAFQPAAPAPAQAGHETSTLCADPAAPLDIVLTLDNSGSIDDEHVDPLDKRFDATDAFIDGLAEIADSGKEIAVNVIFFNTETSPSGWQNIDDDGDAASIQQSIRTGWAEPNGDTDHVKAFETSYAQLEDRSGHCKIVVMFTDGVMDTGPGKTDEDINRALTQSQPCTPLDGVVTEGAGGQTLAEQALDLDVTTFVLVLNPDPGTEGFQGRLDATVTLFSAVTGDLVPPNVGSDYEVQCISTIDGQRGEIFSANDVNRMLAHFYRIGDEVGGGTAVVEECPQPFADGTRPLPSGSLIDRLTIINFDAESGSDSTNALDDFTLRTESGDIPASNALEGNTTNPIRWKLTIKDPELIPGGWSLIPPDSSSYCVQLFERTDLAASLSSDSGSIKLQKVGDDQTLDVAYDPTAMAEQVELTVDIGGQQASTESDTIAITVPVEWAETGVPDGTAVAKALATEIFQSMPVKLDTSSLSVQDFTDDSLPKITCESADIQLGGAEAPDSGTIEAVDTKCEVTPGKATGGERTFLVLESITAAADPAREGSDNATVLFTLQDDPDAIALKEGHQVEILEATSIWVSIEGLDNERTVISDEATFFVLYGLTDQDAEIKGDESVEVVVDLKGRSNQLIAALVTFLVMLLFAIASMLLLWLFNRLTAKLPDGSKFYYQRLNGNSESSTGPASRNNKDMKPARSSRGTLQLGSVEIRLDHPPVWKPLADSIGVIHAPGPAVADPTGPSGGTVPLGFSNLLIATRRSDRDVEYTAVVPRSGPRSGIDGVQAMSNDTTRRNRVMDRLDRHDPEPNNEASSTDTDIPDGSTPTPQPKTPDTQDDPSSEPDATHPKPREPGPSGPRLPGG